ncbi:spore germination protein [Aquibacillus koreensis]|uniref:Spore germination protein n=2 Tax=Aquibacillus koreensis TaxID=279446 RepID=A0A9X4AJ31_9BACI|nr:spore germination protein [Aquibacillus koreensis]MCT2537084.1 spore germination protein [Aquibacillus koreensis]MDC3419933.1 spore germination protein [Aquibacillus koreensis]
MKQSDDFSHFEFHQMTISFYKTLVDQTEVHQGIFSYFQNNRFDRLEEIKQALPIDDITLTSDVDTVKEKMMQGYLLLQHATNQQVLLIPAKLSKARDIAPPEIEYSVIGPKEAFVEDMDININLIRKRLPLPQLQVKELTVGKLTKTKVAIIYIDGIVNPDNVETVTQRISDIEFDQIIDSSFIAQMISDNSNSPFPQLIDTERPDRVASVLSEGKVAVICDGSPHALTGPTTLVEFFSAYEDYFLPWHIATIFRIIRLFAILFSVLITPLYVAVLTYHYQIIPMDLLGTIISSRRDIPFPPILEALILELTIELLREAGARLPMKIGQTIGIVGGIVIGTAAVEAGLTSNVLLILVALSALASFTTPIYRIGNTIRLIRFPFIILAQLWGLIGVLLAFLFCLSHLLKLTSIGRPYTEPFYPPRLQDLKDSFIRAPFSSQTKRPILTRTSDTNRMNASRVKAKQGKRK